MPAISVIIPVYNVEPYLRECLDSVVNQTFRDLEIICVNDGSTDGGPAILEEYAAKDSRIQIVTKENGGLSDARNAGLAIASGDFILFVDSDDYLAVNACQTLYSKAVETNSDMVMFLFKCFGNSERSPSDSVSYYPEVLTDCLEKIQYEFNNWQTAWSNLFRRKIIDENNLRFHKGLIFEDVPFVAKASLLANKIAIVPKKLYFYRQREDSIMQNKQQRNFLSRPLSFQYMYSDILSISPDNALLWLLSYKYSILYNTYYNKISKNFRSEMGQRIKQNITEEERRFMVANAKSFEPKTFAFFLKFSGLTFLRWKYNIKRAKWGVFNWFAKRLVPYSPWLQHTLETVDSQREQIQILQEQLEKSKDE